MTGLRALVLLEAFRLRNTVRSIAKKPSRLGSWLFFALWIAFIIWSRSRRHAQFFPLLTQQIAAVVLGGFLLWLGLRALSAANSGTPVRATRVAAIMLERSSIDERLVFLWLLIGSIARQFAIAVVSVSYLLVNLGRTPQSLSVINLTAMVLLIDVAAVPAYALRRFSRPTARVLTGAIAVGGALLIALALTAPNSVSAYSLFFTRIWSGDPVLTAWLCVAIIASLSCSAFARDFFPELYATSGGLMAMRDRLRARRGTRSTFSTSSRRSFLRGPLVEIWKQLAYLRRGNGRTIAAWLVLLGPALGTLEAYLMRHNPDIAFIVASLAAIGVVALTTLGSVSLAEDLSKPIWWMVDGSLFAHLCTCIAAGVLPIAFVRTTACLTASALLRQPLIFAAGAILAVVVPCGLRTIATLGYAISPAKIDQRGPGLIVRTLITYAAAAITVAGAALGVVMFRGLTGALVGAFLAYAGTAALALGIATRIISGRGLEIALAEGS